MKTSWKGRIRDQRCVDKCEITRSKPCGIFSKTCIWEQFAGKHSRLRITVRDNSIHKGMRRRNFRAVWVTKPDLTRTTVLGRSFHCAQNTHIFSSKPTIFAAIPGGTIIGRVIEVQIVKILDSYGIEIAIPSPNGSRRTSYVLISRWKSRFVDELHIPNAEFRPSAELLSKAEEKRTRLASRRLVRTLSAFLPAKRPCSHKEPFPRHKGSGKLFLPSHRMEELCQRSPERLQEWCVITIKMKDNVSDSLGHHKASAAESVRKTGRTRFLRQRGGFDSSIKEAARRGSSAVRIPKIPLLTSSNSRTLWWNNNCAWVDGAHSDSSQLELFTGVVLSASNLSLRTDSFQVERKAREDDRLSSSHHSILSEKIPMKKNPVKITQLTKKYTITAIGNATKKHCIGKKFSRAPDRGLQFWQTKSHAIIVHSLVHP